VIDLRTHARSTRNFGTPLYMSPEQYDGDPHIDHRTDLYSLGHIAFTLLVGHPYWEPESQALAKLVQRIMGGASEPATERGRRWNAHLPAEFDGWFAKATARDPFARFDSAGEMVGELANTLGVDLPRSSRPYLAAASGPQKKQRRSRRTIVGITILLVGCGTLASWLLPSAPKSAARAGAEPPASSAPSASGESIELPAIVEPQPPPTASAVEAPSAFAPTPAASAVSKPVTIVPASSGAKKASMGSRTTKASDTF
jgi:serine/threonine-protein kinase